MDLVTWGLLRAYDPKEKNKPPQKKEKKEKKAATGRRRNETLLTKLSIYQIAIFQPLSLTVVMRRPSQLGLEGQLQLSGGRQPTAHFTPIEEFPDFYCILSPS